MYVDVVLLIFVFLSFLIREGSGVTVCVRLEVGRIILKLTVAIAIINTG